MCIGINTCNMVTCIWRWLLCAGKLPNFLLHDLWTISIVFFLVNIFNFIFLICSLWVSQFRGSSMSVLTGIYTVYSCYISHSGFSWHRMSRSFCQFGSHLPSTQHFVVLWNHSLKEVQSIHFADFICWNCYTLLPFL